MAQIRKAIVAHPEEYFSRMIVMAQCFDMPGHYSPYTLDFHAGTYEYLRPWRWCRIHDAAMHGSWLRRFVHIQDPRADWRVSFSFFVLVATLVATVASAWRLRDEREFALLLLAGMYLWMMLCVILVDGYEGSRMRWHLQPAAVILTMGMAMRIAGATRRALPRARRD